MRPYDLSLIVVRVTAATWLVQAAVTTIFTCIRIGIAVAAATNFHTRNFVVVTEISQLTIPLEEAVAGAAFLLFSKSLACFGAKAVKSIVSD